MIITAVERIARRRGRVAVCVDGVSAFDIARDTAAARALKPGRPIDRAEIDAMIAADRRRVALDAAVAMLARRPHSEREVRQRLARRACEPAVIEETVVKLQAARLLDDAEYARAFTEARDRFSPRGQRLIARELRANGVALDVAQAAAAEVSDEDAAYRVASKRLRPLAALDYQAFRNRLGAFLQRRGFGWDTCRATVDRCWRDLHDAAPDEDV
jgi:regulatory protein